LTHDFSVVNKYMVDPKLAHLKALKWMLRYLKGTMSSGLVYGRSTLDKVVIKGYVDVDYAWNIDTKK